MSDGNGRADISVTPSRIVHRMNRGPPETHRELLAALARRIPPELDDIDPDILAELRKWGMVMERSREVAGTGSRYLGDAERGGLE